MHSIYLLLFFSSHMQHVLFQHLASNTSMLVEPVLARSPLNGVLIGKVSQSSAHVNLLLEYFASNVKMHPHVLKKRKFNQLSSEAFSSSGTMKLRSEE